MTYIIWVSGFDSNGHSVGRSYRIETGKGKRRAIQLAKQMFVEDYGKCTQVHAS